MGQPDLYGILVALVGIAGVSSAVLAAWLRLILPQATTPAFEKLPNS
jgi:hypothetical protein